MPPLGDSRVDGGQAAVGAWLSPAAWSARSGTAETKTLATGGSHAQGRDIWKSDQQPL